MYWCAASSKGDAELVVAKWTSITNHVANIHSGHHEKFPQCSHGTLEDRAWIPHGEFSVRHLYFKLVHFIKL